ncbi:hypothetical protein [Rhodanobacter terrae]|uniref:Uncharacterized protein n=1 Tax=Rhodanobacter terrae TaxID=418647 RepID=A0ABW0T1R6_9GAMM
MAAMTDAEWHKLYENFETTRILAAVDSVDSLRDDLNDRDHGAPPVIRDDLLKLHQLAMAVVNNGALRQASEFFDLAGALDDQVSGMRGVGADSRHLVGSHGAVSGKLGLCGRKRRLIQHRLGRPHFTQ